MKVRLKKYRYLLLFAALCLLMALLVVRPGRWLMSERDVLEYYRQTYGQEMEVLSRNAKEFQEGDTHTRSQVFVLRPLDQPDLEFQFDEWAGYAYSPGPIPQIFPSFSRSFNDHYPSDALLYALREFVDARGLGTIEETDDDRNITITADDWEGAVREVVAFVNSLQDVSPYSHLENIWLLTFRRTLDAEQEAVCRADLLPGGRFEANAEDIIREIQIAGNLTRAANQLIDELDAFLSESGLSYRSEYGYNNWIFCRTLTVSIDVASLAELDGVLAQLAAFTEARRNSEPYTAEGLRRVPVTVHFVQKGVEEPKGQIGTWTPFESGGLSIDTDGIRERIVKLDLLPDVLSPSDSTASGMQQPSDLI